MNANDVNIIKLIFNAPAKLRTSVVNMFKSVSLLIGTHALNK